MRPTRILLIDMPRMLRELIQATIAAHPELEVVGTLDAADSLSEAIEEAHADVVIVGAEVVEPNRRVSKPSTVRYASSHPQDISQELSVAGSQQANESR